MVGWGLCGLGWLLVCIRGGCVGALGGVRAWMALAAGLDRRCVAGRGGRVNLCTAKAFARLLEKPRLSLPLSRSQHGMSSVCVERWV